MLRVPWWLSARKDDYDYVCDRGMRHYTDRVSRMRARGREYKMARHHDDNRSRRASIITWHFSYRDNPSTSANNSHACVRLLYEIRVNWGSATLFSFESKSTGYTVQSHVRPHADETVPSLATTDNLSPGRATPSMGIGTAACASQTTRDFF